MLTDRPILLLLVAVSPLGCGGIVDYAPPSAGGFGSSGVGGSFGSGGSGGFGSGSGGVGGPFGTGGLPAAGGAPSAYCLPGSYGDPDGKCEPCPLGTYSASTAATFCEEWTACEAGEVVSVPGTTTGDVGCMACDAGYFSAGRNSLACEPCPIGTFSEHERASSCSPWSTSCGSWQQLTVASATSDICLAGSGVRILGGASDDVALGLAVDLSGSVLVTGYSYSEELVGVAADPASYPGAAFAAGYDEAGQLSWVTSFAAYFPYESVGRALTTDLQGSTFTVGNSSTDSGQAAFVAKTSPSGVVLWSRQLGYGTQANAVAATTTGEAVIGGTASELYDVHVVVAKMTSEGALAWMAQVSSTYYDVPVGVGVDSAGNVILAGRTYGVLPGATGEYSTNNSGDMFLSNFDGSGNSLWTVQYGSELDDVAFAFAVDPEGNLLLGGSTSGELPGGQYQPGYSNPFVAKFDATGQRLWTVQLSSPSARIVALSADSAGNIFALRDNPYFGQDSSPAAVLKFNADGALLWSRDLDVGQGSSVTALAVSPGGIAYVGGITYQYSAYGGFPGQPSFGGADIFVLQVPTP